MSLKEYKNKRDFSKTPEPEAEKEKTGGSRFVIQRHEASRLHYDLRLEIDGTLKSWAVPKGPSMNPSDKRLAVQTEDHPIKYLHFEGTIPKGNYGAGKMKIWDEGNFEVYEKEEKGEATDQWKEGSLKVIFHGQKLKGKFALFKMKGGTDKNQWLLVKKEDEFSTDDAYDAENYTASHKIISSKNLKKNS